MSYFLNNVNKENSFVEITRNDYFVDKSELISKLNNLIRTSGKYICITRPRRFGKSINAAMLASYYAKNLDAKDIFDKLNVSKCDSYEEHLNKHNVIYISFNTKAYKLDTYMQYLDYFESKLISDLLEFCPDINHDDFLSDILDAVYRKTGVGFIFIIDEWDYIFNKDMYTKDDRKNFLEFLEDLLKDRSYVELAYMTGILPIGKNSSGSSLNMFSEYDAINDELYGKYFGFLEEEVENLCKKQNVVSMDELREWYDGYYTEQFDHIYNPRSVVYALKNGKCRNYWTKTGKMKEISNYINTNIAGVKEDIVAMLSGQELGIVLGGFDTTAKELKSTRNLILSALTVLGFLSYYTPPEYVEMYKQLGVDPIPKVLKIPNKEIALEFDRILTDSDIEGMQEVITDSKEMLQATIDKNIDKMLQLVEKAHATYNSYFDYNLESSLACIITILYLYARTKYVVKREDVGAKGRADFSFYPLFITDTAFIIELKKNDTADNAIAQIKEKEYFSHFKNFRGEKLLIGIAYDTDTKKHSIKIEELE